MSEPAGPGEMLERKQRSRQALILGLLMAVGGVCGLILVLAAPDGAGFHQGAIPAWVAILLAVIWLVAVVGGSLWYKRHVDEIEQAAQIFGIAIGGTIVIVLYPVWYLLWRGQMVAEPNAHIMFGALYLIMACAYLGKKFG